jgi:hypothetical protein
MHVYQYLTDRFLMQHINEFQRPDIHGAPAQAFFVIIALTLAGIIAVRGRMRWANWLLILFSIISGLYAARNLPFASMLLMILTAPLLSKASATKSGLFVRMNRWQAAELSPHVPVWPIMAVIFGAILCLHHGGIFSRQVMDAHFDPARVPVQAVDALQRQGIHEPIFSLDAWGGYFIYRLYPQNKVFVDDRHDFYGDAYIREYLDVIHLQSGWAEVLDRWKVNLIVMPVNSDLGKTLSSSPHWQTFAKDATAIVLTRRMGTL